MGRVRRDANIKDIIFDVLKELEEEGKIEHLPPNSKLKDIINKAYKRIMARMVDLLVNDKTVFIGVGTLKKVERKYVNKHTSGQVQSSPAISFSQNHYFSRNFKEAIKKKYSKKENKFAVVPNVSKILKGGK